MEILSLGETILIYRKRAKLSVKELANQVGVSPSTIRRYEDKEITHYNPDVLINIALALNINVNKLISKIEDPNKRKEMESLITALKEILCL